MWFSTSEIAKVLGLSPEKTGWLLRKLGLRRKRVKGRSYWFIEPNLLPNDLREKLLPLINSTIEGGSNTAIPTLLTKDVTPKVAEFCYHEESITQDVVKRLYDKVTVPQELLEEVYDYLKRNHPVIEEKKIREVVFDSIKELINELIPKGYKPIQVEKAMIEVLKSYSDTGFMSLLTIGDLS